MMSEKDFGLLSVVLVAASLVGTGFYLYYQNDRNKAAMMENYVSVDAQSGAAVVDEKLMAKVTRFKASLDIFSGEKNKNAVREIDPIFWGMFGDEIKVASVEYFEKLDDYSVLSDFYSVSMTYISKNARYAVVNGKMYQVNSDLTEGGKLLAIDESKVKIVKVDPEGVTSTAWVQVANRLYNPLLPEGRASNTPTGEGERAEYNAANPVRSTVIDVLTTLKTLKQLQGR